MQSCQQTRNVYQGEKNMREEGKSQVPKSNAEKRNRRKTIKKTLKKTIIIIIIMIIIIIILYK